MRRVLVLRGQSIWDIAIQEYGSIEALFLLLDDNADQLIAGVDSVITEGQVLRVKAQPVDGDIQRYYHDNDLHPVTGPITDGGAFSDDWSDGFSI